MKGLVTRNLHVKYENPTTYGSRDIAQVKVLSTDNDNDADDAGRRRRRRGYGISSLGLSSRRAKNQLKVF